MIKLKGEIRLLEGADPYSTTIVVGHPDYFQLGDVLHIPRTGEHLLVQAFQEQFEKKALQVIRGFGGSKVAPIEDDDPVWILGRAGERQKVHHEYWNRDGDYAKWVEEELLPAVDLVKKGD
jgi:hypothetical protein